MSIVSAYKDPEREHMREVLDSIERTLGPLWYFAEDEQAFIKRLELHMLTDEEKCYALDRYRKIKSGVVAQKSKPHYPPAVVWGCVILAIALFIWGFCRG